MKLKITDIVTTLILNLIHCTYAEHILPCPVNSLDPCPGNHQICNQTSHQCVCLEGFVRIEDDCEENDQTKNSHVTATVVIIFTIALLICGLVLVVKKYKLVDYMRHKLNVRRSNDVVYEDVMIGQDDPPLSP